MFGFCVNAQLVDRSVVSVRTESVGFAALRAQIHTNSFVCNLESG